MKNIDSWLWTPEERRRLVLGTVRSFPKDLRYRRSQAKDLLGELSDIRQGLRQREYLKEHLHPIRLTRKYRGVYRRDCGFCGVEFFSKRSHAEYCTTNHRVRAWQGRQRKVLEVLLQQVAAGGAAGKAIKRCVKFHHSLGWLVLRKIGLNRKYSTRILYALRL